MYIEKQSYYKKTLNAEYNRRSGRFVVYLQPKVEIETGRIIGAEALVRKSQKDSSLVMPDAFIPIYELENVICHVDLYVLEEVCKILRQWTRTGILFLKTYIGQRFFPQIYAGRSKGKLNI